MGNIAILFLLPLVSGFSNMGTVFDVAFPPSENVNTPNDGQCRLYLNAFTQTDIAIIPTRTGLLETAAILPVLGRVYEIDCLDRVGGGVESKVVRLTSLQEIPFSVQLYTEVGGRGDMVTIFPTSRSNDTYGVYNYYLNSLPVGNCAESTKYNAAFTVASYTTSNNTEISVYNKPVTDSPVDLEYLENVGEWETWGELGMCNMQIDFTGYRISSFQPLSVISGSLYTNYDSSRFASGFQSAVNSEWVGREYVVPPIVRPSSITVSFEYYIKVIALVDGDIVQIRDQMDTVVVAKLMELNEVFEYQIQDGTDAYIVSCVNDCLVFAYPRRTTAVQSGGYQFHIPSTQRGTNQAVFRKYDSTTRAAIVSIISNTVNVNINGGLIEGWSAMMQRGLFFTTVQIPTGANGAQLLTTNEPRGAFQAYINGELASQYAWYGDIVGVGALPLDDLFLEQKEGTP